MTDATINDAVLKQLAEFPDLGEELQQIALQRLTEAGEIQAALERIAGLEAALRDLLSYVERNECQHEDTHRGGAIWTICDGCGMKWADDKGGFRPYAESKPITDARAALAGEAAPRLTDRQIDNVTRRQCGGDLDLVLAYRQFARAIEAKVRGE